MTKDVVSTDAPKTISAPTYNELFELVTQLSGQVKALTARSPTVLDKQAEVSDVSTESDVAEYRVVPDLNRSVNQFTGRESSHEAENWLDDMNGIASANHWPIRYRLQFVRANLQGAARDWFVGRIFANWSDFEMRFRTTFIRTLNTSDRYDLLKARTQKKDEHVMDYFQPKVRLCRDLSLPFSETRDHVLKGLYSREMALYALGRIHLTEEDLLGDLLEWSRMSAIHTYDYKLKGTKPSVRKSDENLKAPKPTGTWARAKPSVSKVSDETARATPGALTASCWTCKKTGHLSRDCPSKRNNVCYGCGVEGHIRPNCPEREQASVAVSVKEAGSHPYRKFGRINGRDVDVLLDTGCHPVLIKASVAVSCGLSIKPVDKPSRFATTAHVIQLKSWKLCDEAEPEAELEQQTENGGGSNEDGGMSSGLDAVLEPEEGVNGVPRRPVRNCRPPDWLQDYELNV
ncbi:hypothetical protein AGLY_016380 [Aphis glycines]|uniref:CCHC-type domain-containing protein n=1 Tax=Aphis glycines TaxID=307491 RepID=A0A6G0SXW8_APHGL|nr:hypothetical protein AGLY_016380 [Aphis glycines]